MVKTRNYVLIGIVAILLCVVGGVVGATFSRYTSTATATPTAKVAKWKVLVGNQDISSGETKSFDATVTWDENVNIQTGFIAPGSKGKMTFVINANETQVPVDYTVNINTEEINLHKQIKITKVTATPSEGTEADLSSIAESSTYSGKIELSEISKPVTVTVYVEWAAQENDSDDTTIGSTLSTISLPITVTANQRIAG